MRLLGIFDDRAGPSARHRFDPYRESLEVAGCELERVDWPRGAVARTRLLSRARAFDAVYLQRRLLSPWIARRLRRCARRWIYDFDDALDLRERAPHDSRTRRRRFAATVRETDLVLAGNDELAERARAHGARRIEVLPTVVVGDSDEAARSGLGAQIGQSRNLAHLLWLGQPSTFRYLEVHLAELEDLRARYPNLTLTVVGAGEVAASWVRSVPWTPESEIAELARGGLALAPLPDDPWTRGKCGLRVLRCLEAGMEVVASAVGVQAEISRASSAVVAVDPGESFVAAVERRLAAGPHTRECATGVPPRWLADAWRSQVVGWLTESRRFD